MKRFIKKVIFFGCFCLLISFFLSYFVDPYNVFHWNNIRNNGIEPNKNYIKTKYILNNPAKFDGFLFGSSRVSTIHVEKIQNMSIYNMTYSAGTPKEHYETLKTFIDNGVNLDVVYMGVDSLSYTEDPEKHLELGIRSPYQYLQNSINFIKIYIDPSMVFQSLPTIIKGYVSGRDDAFYDYGCFVDYNTNFNMDWSTAVPVLGDGYRLEETLQEISDIKDLCENNNIELIVFTNPMCEITYRESVEHADYLKFIRKLSEIVHFYNFSGLNKVTENTDNFLDASHYNAYVGDMIIDTIINNNTDQELYEQGFGWYVTENNIDDLVMLNAQGML